MEHDFYAELARFRIYTMQSVSERSKRSPNQIYASFDKELTRIANSIQKGYTLGAQRMTKMNELYRPYRYVDLSMTVLNHPQLDFEHPSIKWIDVYKPTHPPEIKVVITRGSESIIVTDENISKLVVWCKQWKIRKPETMDECEDINFYLRWW